MKFNRVTFFIYKWLIAPIFRLFYCQKVTGVKNLPKEGSYILAPNHGNKFDPEILESFTIRHLNRKLFYLAKSHPVWAFFGRTVSRHAFGVIVYHRKTTRQEAFKEAHDILEDGVNGNGETLVIFPEGEARQSPDLQIGKTGAVRLAIWFQVPIIPVGIVSSKKILPEKKRKSYRGVELKFGKPIHYNQFKDQTITKELLHKLTDDLMRKIAKLSGQRYNIKR
jgi:1-acyl-sn-glycerol-3-phosphate acyltransferase